MVFNMEIDTETIFITVSIVFFMVGLVFVSIGVYACKRKTPMYFYAGTEISESDITDVKAYNRANGIMWGGYGLLYFIPICIYLFAPDKINDTVLSVTTTMCILEIFALLWIYQKIDEKYRIHNE